MSIRIATIPFTGHSSDTLDVAASTGQVEVSLWPNGTQGAAVAFSPPSARVLAHALLVAADAAERMAASSPKLEE
jgi:hypothetical protein